MKRLLAALCLIAFLLAPVFATSKIHPVSGGTRTEPDPKVKNQIILIAEKPEYRLTLSTNDKAGKKFQGMISVQLKIENLSDQPLSFSTSKFSAVDHEGRGYNGLEFQEMVSRFANRTAGKRTVIGMVVAGALAGSAMTDAAMKKLSEDMRKISLESGTVPPHSFKEGAIFFEAPEAERFVFKVNLTDLWQEPFIFATEKAPEEKKK